MSVIQFKCRHCQQHLEAGDDMAGMEFECSACGGSINVPAASTVQASRFQSPATPPDTKLCPECKNEISVNAVICVNCGLNLKTGKVIPAYRETGVPSQSLLSLLKEELLSFLQINLKWVILVAIVVLPLIPIWRCPDCGGYGVTREIHIINGEAVLDTTTICSKRISTFSLAVYLIKKKVLKK